MPIAVPDYPTQDVLGPVNFGKNRPYYNLRALTPSLYPSSRINVSPTITQMINRPIPYAASLTTMHPIPMNPIL